MVEHRKTDHEKRGDPNRKHFSLSGWCRRFDSGPIWQSATLTSMVVARYIQDGLNGVVGEEYEYPYGQGRIVAVEESVE